MTRSKWAVLGLSALALLAMSALVAPPVSTAIGFSPAAAIQPPR